MTTMNEWIRILEETVVTYSKIQSRNSPGGNEENHEKPQSGEPIAGVKVCIIFHQQ